GPGPGMRRNALRPAMRLQKRARRYPGATVGAWGSSHGKILGRAAHPGVKAGPMPESIASASALLTRIIGHRRKTRRSGQCFSDLLKPAGADAFTPGGGGI